MSSFIHFQYIQDEEDDDPYIPRHEVNVTHGYTDHGTLEEVVETFKTFLISVGFMHESVDKVKVVK